MDARFKLSGVFLAECFDKDGNLKWRDSFDNLVVNEGLQEAIDSTLLGGTQDSTWFLGLTTGTPVFAAGDTLASHAGWTEFTTYTGTRQSWVGVRSGQTATNSASVAAFPITGTATVGGGFLCGVTSGTAGVLFSGSAFSGGNRSVESGDTINLTYSVTAAAS